MRRECKPERRGRAALEGEERSAPLARLPSVASGILVEIEDRELHPSDHDGLPVVAPHKLELDAEHLLIIYHVPANLGPANVDLPEPPTAKVVPLEGLGREGAR